MPTEPVLPPPDCEQQILDCWFENAGPWVDAIRNQEIASRVLTTNQAITSAVLATRPASVIDVGCGEGWLVRRLLALGIAARGLDVVPELVESAARQGGEFAVASYEDIGRGAVDWRADTVSCNFALIGKDSTERLLRGVPRLLNPGGSFIVQTLHPAEACGTLAYQDGWRQGSWDGFNQRFVNAAPWYFRTLESWRALFAATGLRLVSEHWPVHTRTGKPASVVFSAVVDQDAAG
jgi:2-polyprenyl-3-methyl-5-hydroxy-6-metoxy-1,4-benzoquinol methylase